jgi:SAM-dependent methyltransferase
MACLVCRGTSLTPLHERVRDHYGVATGTYRFLRCAGCGSATLDPIPTADALTALYSDDYTFKPPEPSAGLRGLLAALEWRLFYRRGYVERLGLIRCLTGLGGGRVLEIGCGSGLFLHVLREAGWEVTGLDTSKADVDYARERFGLEVTRGTVEALAGERGRWDLVVMVYVLEHIATPAETLGLVFDLLRPGGWLVLGLPVLDSLQARVLGRRWSAITEAPRHVVLPSFEGARRLLAGAGFEDLRWAPAPLLENAGHVALSLLPGAATPRSWGRLGVLGSVARRAAGALMLLPGLAVAGLERWPGGERARTGTMFFAGRR